MARVQTYSLADEKRIAELVKKLSISREEAIDIVNADKAIDKGENLFELSAEQKKVEKKMRNSAGKKVDAYGKASTRTRKADREKRELIDKFKALLTENAENVSVTNIERQIDFSFKGRNFRVVLSAPRAKKE